MTTADSSSHPSHPPHNAHVILVVDDALDSLRMLCDALAAEGYVVLAARDADEALQRFALTVPDGVLLDAVMPGMDGFTLCRTLKATPAWAHVPVVFMTGLSDTDQIIRGFASGGVDYVVKPLRIPEVLVRLATHVRNARATRQAQEAVDVAGLGVVVLDGQGRVAWRSPQASRWLEEAFADQPFPLEAAGDWLAGARQPDQHGKADQPGQADQEGQPAPRIWRWPWPMAASCWHATWAPAAWGSRWCCSATRRRRRPPRAGCSRWRSPRARPRCCHG
ncbi:response regulator [Delftia acidovorans]|uniref:response regulator n=1 Tax=Delftia acidovorans TaxID=80866 RepID=UPI0039F73C5F